MEVLQVGYNFIDKAMIFTVGKDNVNSISITEEGNAVINLSGGSILTVKEKYVMSYVAGNPLVSESKKIKLDDFHKNKKKFKSLKR